MRPTIKRILAGTLALAASSIACSESSNDAARQCEPRAPLGGSFYPHAALPTGSCSNEPACGLTVGEDCGCGAGPVNGYTCTCRASTWDCVVTSQGASTCPAPPSCGHPDAATPKDAAID